MRQEPPGTRIGRYEVVQRIEGQPIEVYLARGPRDRLNPQFVLVLFEVREVDARIIEAEVERCKRVDHPCVMRPVELLRHQRKHALVLEGPPGTSLDRLMAQLRGEDERLPDVAVYHVGHSLFSALDAVHTLKDADGRSAPVVHGQLGPHLLMISWSGALRIIGFGMSRVFRVSEAAFSEPEVEAFLAPEQRAGHAATPRGNVYSAAAIVWSLLTNELPPTDDSKPQSLLERRQDLPTDLVGCIDQALEPVLTRRNITSGEVAAVFAEHAQGRGQRDLRWVIDVFRGLGEGTLDLAASDSVPLGKLSAEPEPRGPRSPSIPPFADDADAEDLLADLWHNLDGAGGHALVGDRRRANGEHARRNSSTPAASAIRERDEAPTPPRPAERVTPLPPPVIEQPEEPDDGRLDDEETPPGEAVATELASDDELAAPTSEDEGDEEGGIYIRPSLRPGALSETPFLTPSNYPPAIGGPPFPEVQDYDDPAMATDERGAALGLSGAALRFRLRSASLPVKGAAVLVVAVLFAFVAGMILASGPMHVKVGSQPSGGTAGATDVPRDTSEQAEPLHVAAPAEQQASASSRATADAGALGLPTTRAGTEGSDLPPSHGYLIVHCPDRPDLRVYLHGKVVRLGEKVQVRCGLANFRLGTYPLGTWYGLNRTVPVACQSVTEVTMKAGEPIDPGIERGDAYGPRDSSTVAKPTDAAGGAPPPSAGTTEPDEPYED